MTDPTPPSIPPRARPKQPVTTGRTATSSAGRAQSTAAWVASPAEAEESTTTTRTTKGRTARSGSTPVPPPPPPETSAAGSATGTSTRPTVPAPKGADSSGGAGRGTTSSSAGASKRAPGSGGTPTSSPNGSSGSSSNGGPSKSDASKGRSPAGDATTTAGAPNGTTDDGTSEQHDPPSPLMVAVDTASTWIKKAAGATSAAVASAARPRTEEAHMTTLPTTSTATAPSTSAGTTAPPVNGAGAGAATSTATQTGSSARPHTGRIPTVGHSGPRRVRLAISRIDPWSVMKLSFLLSVAIGIMLVVAVGVVWYTLNGLHVFTTVDDLVSQIVGQESPIDILQYVEFSRVISGATIIAVVDVFLLTALATIGAFLYNIVAALVGGVHVTMTDE